jgi:uncharacterized protein YfiM (DUF2279 family)
MAYDPATGQLILFGGSGNSGSFSDTWNWGRIELPIPQATATPSSQTICSGSSTSIALSSNVTGTTFSWTVVEQGVIGASAGSSSSIAQTLNTTTSASGKATYTITPTSAGCIGSPISVVVTVNPIPQATATPSSQTICSGSSTSIMLNSNVTGTTFSWTVIEQDVTGASAGSGSFIAQTLNTTTSASGKATYTITPTSPNGCIGSPINVVVKVKQCLVEGPTHFQGKIKYNKFASQTDIVHVLSWQASPDPNVRGYKIFQGHKLIKIFHGRNVNKLKLHNRKKNKVYHYGIVAFTASGTESQPVKLTLPM